MKKILFILFSVILLSCIFISCSQQSNDKAKLDDGKKDLNTGTTQNSPSPIITESKNTKLKVSLDTTYKPMEYLENGQIMGFDADLIKAIAKQMGRETELKTSSWVDIFDKLYTGESDILISSITMNDDRKKTMLFTEPYFESPTLILTKKSLNIRKVKDLVGKTLAIQRATTQFDSISKNIAGIKLVSFNEYNQTMDCFLNGGADALIADGPAILYLANQKNDPLYEIVKDEEFFATEKFGIAVKKGNEQLLTEINAALSKVKNNGEYDRIYKQYFK